MMLGMPGGEEGGALRLGETVEVGDLGEASGRRLFEQAVEARLDAFAGDRVTRAGRRGDRHRFQALDAVDQLAPVGELVPDALTRPARRRDQLEARIGFDRGDMLVLGNLAIADDSDPDRPHAPSPAT